MADDSPRDDASPRDDDLVDEDLDEGKEEVVVEVKPTPSASRRASASESAHKPLVYPSVRADLLIQINQDRKQSRSGNIDRLFPRDAWV